jgi:hypothetical protein
VDTPEGRRISRLIKRFTVVYGMLEQMLNSILFFPETVLGRAA